MLETFQAGVYALSFDWISGSSGGRWASHCRMGQIKRLSIWGLSHDHLNNRFETIEWAHEFFEQHTTCDNWVTPVHLGLHMIDNTHHVDLFKFIAKMLYRDNVHLRSLDIGFEGDNNGVMSIHPPIKYFPPVTRNGVINQLVRRTQELYNLTAEKAEIRLHKYGRRHYRNMYDDFPEFEAIYRPYYILQFNHDLAGSDNGFGILRNLAAFKERDDINRECFNAFYARGFERDFKNDDVMRLETLPLRACF